MQNIAISSCSTVTIYETILIRFVTVVFVFFVDTISITVVISWQSINEVSAKTFKTLLFSQMDVC